MTAPAWTTGLDAEPLFPPRLKRAPGARRIGDAHAGRNAYRAGVAAEYRAEQIYAAEGGRVLARRWRCPEGEIDLAVELDGTLVFVEVKARRDGRVAAEALGPRQAARLRAAASRFLADRPSGQEARIDVVLVDRFGQAERIENAVHG